MAFIKHVPAHFFFYILFQKRALLLTEMYSNWKTYCISKYSVYFVPKYPALDFIYINSVKFSQSTHILRELSVFSHRSSEKGDSSVRHI